MIFYRSEHTFKKIKLPGVALVNKINGTEFSDTSAIDRLACPPPKDRSSVTLYLTPYPLYPSIPLPSVTTTLLSVSEFLFAGDVYVFVTFFISHWVKSHGSRLFWHISLSTTFHQDPPTVLQWPYHIFSYGRGVFHGTYVPRLYPVIHQRTLQPFPCPGHCE